MKKIVLLLFSFLSIFIALGIVEAFVRVISLKGKGNELPSDRPLYYFQDEKAETLQDYSYQKTKPANTYRIAVVGDSYTFAPYMQFTDAFPKILERMLNLSSSNIKAEVINYGVPAYSTSHEVPVVERAIKEGADLVLLQITLNDPEIKPYRPIGITHFNTFGELEFAGWEKTLASYWKTYGLIRTRLYNAKTKREYAATFLDLFENPKTWKNFSDSVTQIDSITKSSSTPIKAIVFPLFGLPLDDNYPFKPCHEKVAKLLTELSIPYLDLLETYKGQPLDRMQVIPGKDRHPNEIAHRMAAEKIYDWLESTGSIPKEIIIKKKFKKRTQIIKEEPFIRE